MFKHSCFIENSKEAREWLEGIGYEESVIFCNEDYYIKTQLNGICYCTKYLFTSNKVNDCRSNLPLFKALTAVSTKTDIGKYYINDLTGQFKRCTYEMATDESIDWDYWSECTKDDLIEKFKNKDE